MVRLGQHWSLGSMESTAVPLKGMPFSKWEHNKNKILWKWVCKGYSRILSNIFQNEECSSYWFIFFTERKKKKPKNEGLWLWRHNLFKTLAKWSHLGSSGGFWRAVMIWPCILLQFNFKRVSRSQDLRAVAVNGKSWYGIIEVRVQLEQMVK